MPFTIGGDWIPDSPSPNKPSKPVKVIKEKRGQSLVTLILNLPLEDDALKALCSKLKQQLGCGGSVKEGKIELQGDKIQQAKAIILKEGYKVP